MSAWPGAWNNAQLCSLDPRRPVVSPCCCSVVGTKDPEMRLAVSQPVLASHHGPCCGSLSSPSPSHGSSHRPQYRPWLDYFKQHMFRRRRRSAAQFIRSAAVGRSGFGSLSSASMVACSHASTDMLVPAMSWLGDRGQFQKLGQIPVVQQRRVPSFALDQHCCRKARPSMAIVRIRRTHLWR